jgi:hypothetical protein
VVVVEAVDQAEVTKETADVVVSAAAAVAEEEMILVVVEVVEMTAAENTEAVEKHVQIIEEKEELRTEVKEDQRQAEIAAVLVMDLAEVVDMVEGSLNQVHQAVQV